MATTRHLVPFFYFLLLLCYSIIQECPVLTHNHILTTMHGWTFVTHAEAQGDAKGCTGKDTRINVPQ